MLGPILTGAVLGLLFALSAYRRGDLRLFVVGLVVAALIYVGLAIPSGMGEWLALEAAGVLVFGGVSWIGLRRTSWLGAGWLAHVGWDVGLHLDRAQSIVGPWYPLGCVGFDLIVAGFLFGVAASRPADLRRAAGGSESDPGDPRPPR
jgi:hypothetical protein